MSQLDLLEIKIEQSRIKLINLIGEKTTLLDKDVIKASQILDKQIYKYFDLIKLNANQM